MCDLKWLSQSRNRSRSWSRSYTKAVELLLAKGAGVDAKRDERLSILSSKSEEHAAR